MVKVAASPELAELPGAWPAGILRLPEPLFVILFNANGITFGGCK